MVSSLIKLTTKNSTFQNWIYDQLNKHKQVHTSRQIMSKLTMVETVQKHSNSVTAQQSSYMEKLTGTQSTISIFVC